MTEPSLAQQIGRQGDRLFTEPLPDRDENGPVPLSEGGRPYWCLSYWSTAQLDANDHDGQSLGFLILIPLFPLMIVVDLVHFLARVLLYLPVQALWAVECWLARRARRRWFCVACHHSMSEPWPYCPEPGCPRPVQTRLRPTFNNLFVKVCPGCRKTRWAILGARLGRSPTPLVCRHTATTSGCYRPLRVAALADGRPTTHVALAGTTVAARHAALAHLVAAWGEAGYAPAWDVSAAEAKLARALLGRAFAADTRPADKPGKSWTLASTLVLAAGERRLALHNLLSTWMARTDELARHSCNWKAVDWLVLAVDGTELSGEPEYDTVTAAEYYSRLVRVAEEFVALRPGEPLPCRVAVLVVWPEGGGPADPSDSEVGQRLNKHDPALMALLRRTAAGGEAEIFGGTVPDNGRTTPAWARRVGAAIAGQ